MRLKSTLGTVEMKRNLVALNQMAGPLFCETIQIIAGSSGRKATIITGHPDTINKKGNNVLKIIGAPEYDRRGFGFRLLSWVKYTLFCIPYLIKAGNNTLFIISTNPPILSLLFNIINKVKKHNYALIIYDIYPSVLINAGLIGKHSSIAKYWKKNNQQLINLADWIITLSNGMRDLLYAEYRCEKNNINVVYPWVNTDVIKPLDIENNPYYQQFNPEKKFVVLYSGNMGKSHDIDTILESAEILKNKKDILFIFFGVGEKWEALRNQVEKFSISNIKVFPLQPEHVFPYSINIGDISIVSLGNGSDKLMIPSKVFDYMAAASSIIGIGNPNAELKKIIEDNKIGVYTEPGDTQSLVEKILWLQNDIETLNSMKKNARNTAVAQYSSNVSRVKIKKINSLMLLRKNNEK